MLNVCLPSVLRHMTFVMCVCYCLSTMCAVKEVIKRLSSNTCLAQHVTTHWVYIFVHWFIVHHVTTHGLDIFVHWFTGFCFLFCFPVPRWCLAWMSMPLSEHVELQVPKLSSSLCRYGLLQTKSNQQQEEA